MKQTYHKELKVNQLEFAYSLSHEGVHVDDQNWQTGLTGVRRRSDRLGFSCSRSDTTDRSDRSKQSPSTTRVFHRFRSCNRISCGASPPTL